MLGNSATRDSHAWITWEFEDHPVLRSALEFHADILVGHDEWMNEDQSTARLGDGSRE
jgi:hypothetical protein